MNLTQDDLQAIGTLIDQKLEEKLDQKLEPIKTELQEHSKILGEHSKRFNNIEKTLGYLKKKVNRIDKTVEIIGRSYDERIVKNSRDVAEIRDKMGLSVKH